METRFILKAAGWGTGLYLAASAILWALGALGVPGFQHYPSLQHAMLNLPGDAQSWIYYGFPLFH